MPPKPAPAPGKKVQKNDRPGLTEEEIEEIKEA